MKWLCLLILIPVLLLSTGCGNKAGYTDKVFSYNYYQHRYLESREAVRERAHRGANESIVLDNLRLGTAALADGDLNEAESALLRAYEYLISGGVNTEDRAVAATVFTEGALIWKGEPFEQAMAFYTIAAMYMVKQDWENARAAMSNSLFRLRDFKGNDSVEGVIETAVEDDDYLDEGYQEIDSEFALGYLLTATNYVLMGLPAEGERLFQQVEQLNPALRPLVRALRGNQYDTLLLVDAGVGPIKQRYGPDESLTRWVPDGRGSLPTITVSRDGRSLPLPTDQPTVDLWRLSQYPKWWSLEEIRRAKSAVGQFLMYSGAAALYAGSVYDSDEAMIAGGAAMIAGALMRATARADIRYLESLPRVTFVVPLQLGPGRHDLTITTTQETGRMVWHDLTSGRPGKPQVYYLRIHRSQPWYQDRPLQMNDHSEPLPDASPYILGGRDLSTPTEKAHARWSANGRAAGLGLGRLLELHQQEGIVYTPGSQGMSGRDGYDRALYRHLIEGGRVLWSPRPGTHAYERQIYGLDRPYEPRSEELKQLRRTQGITPTPAHPIENAP